MLEVRSLRRRSRLLDAIHSRNLRRVEYIFLQLLLVLLKCVLCGECVQRCAVFVLLLRDRVCSNLAELADSYSQYFMFNLIFSGQTEVFCYAYMCVRE